MLCDYSIFVEKKMSEKLIKLYFKRYRVIPCGVNLDCFYPINKSQVRFALGLNSDKNYCLFAGSFNNKTKNYNLAKKAIKLCNKEVTMIEFTNKSRNEVNLLLNAVDFLLLTSLSEGSPQIVKEAMACNCPIVSTNVGDIMQNTMNISGILLCKPNPIEIKSKIDQIIEFSTIYGKTNARLKIIEQKIDSQSIALKVVNVYKEILQNSKKNKS